MLNELLRLSRSLKFRIAFASTLSLAAVLSIVMALLLGRLAEMTLLDYQQREQDEAERLAVVLARIVHDQQQALSIVAAQLSRQTLGQDEQLTELVEARPVLRSLFSSVFVASAEGRLLVYVDDSGTRGLDFNLKGRNYFEQAMTEGRAVISDPGPGRLTGAPVVVLMHPLQDGQGVYGALGGSLRLSSRDLLAGVVNENAVDRNRLTVVADQRGVVIAHPNRERLLKSLADEPRLGSAFLAWSKAGPARQGLTHSQYQPGELVSAAPVAGTNWIIWSTRSAADVLRPAKRAQQEAIAWSVGLLGAMAIITFVLLGWLLKPLKNLTERSLHIFDGSIAADEGWPAAVGEIGRLSEVLRRASEDRANLEARTAVLLKQLASVMAASPVGIAFTRHQKFELVSRDFCRQLGREESALLGSPARMIFAEQADYDALGSKVGEAFKAGQPFIGILRMVRGDGSTFWGRLSGNPVDPADQAAGTIWCLTDFTGEKAAHDELAWSATHDALTGLFNRRAFLSQVEDVVVAGTRYPVSSVVAVDLDHFKLVNDVAGHAAGDAMLRAVSAAMLTAVRADDVVARIGGDEFAILLVGCDESTAKRIADALLTAIADVVLEWGGRQFKVGGSIGVAVRLDQSESVESWLERADGASYEAKAAGRGCVRVATDFVGQA